MSGRDILHVPAGYTFDPNDTSILQPSLPNQTRAASQRPLGHQDPTVALLRDITEIWMCTPITVLGVLGNLVSLFVLCYMRKGKLRAVATMLQALAVSDTLVLVASFWLRTLRYLVHSDWFTHYHAITWPVLFPVNYVLRLVNTWLTVLLTFDRYVAVCHPLHAQSLCTTKRTYVQIVCVVIASFAFCVPRFFETKIEYTPSPQFQSTWLMANARYTVIYRIVLFLVVQYIIPMVVLISLNGRVVWALRLSTANQPPRFTRSSRRPHVEPFCNGSSSLQNSHGPLLQGLLKSTTHAASGVTLANSARDASPKPSQSARSSAGSVRNAAATVTRQETVATAQQQHTAARTLTRIVVAIVLLCTVCHVFSMISHVLLSVESAFLPGLDLWRRYFSNVSNLLVTFNSAVNFLIYCALSRNFRAILNRCLRGVPCRRRGRHPLRSGHLQLCQLRRRSTTTCSSGTKRGPGGSPGQSMSTPMPMIMMSKTLHGITPETSVQPEIQLFKRSTVCLE